MLVEIEEEETMIMSSGSALPLLSLNHVSLVVRSVWMSAQFYQDVLGFFLIKRPSSFNFHGAWLFNYGIGIHLLENESLDIDTAYYNVSRPINPKDNHISFQCTDVEVVKRRLREMGMKYETGIVKEEGIEVDQVFFHDPDGYMIELCNCNLLPVLPLSSPPYVSCPSFKMNNFNENYKRLAVSDNDHKPCWRIESAMMEKLSMDMMNFSF